MPRWYFRKPSSILSAGGSSTRQPPIAITLTAIMIHSRLFLPFFALLAGLSSLHAEDKPAALPTPGLTALAAEGTPLKAGMKISVFGDSLTMQGGYLETMKKALAASPATKDLKVEIVKHGLNGGRVPTVLEGQTPWGKLGGTMQELLDKDQPGVLIIFLGVNDVWHKEKGTTPENFRAGLKKMAEMGKTAKARLVFVTPACIGEKPDGSNEFDKKLDEYCQMVRDVAKESGAGLADVRKAVMDYLQKNNVKDEQGKYKKDKILTYDGVHLQGPGNALVADCISQAIVDTLRAAK
jgi:lysophospholipase L1-like esterase